MLGGKVQVYGGGLEEEGSGGEEREGSEIDVNRPRVPRGAGSKIL